MRFVAALCVLLLAACWFDYRKRTIPNVLIVIAMILGIALNLYRGGISETAAFSGRMILAAVPLYLFFMIGAVGAGDVKLFGVTAGFLPFEKILYFLFVSLLIAAMISLIKLLKNNDLTERLEVLMKYFADVWRSGKFRRYPAKAGSDGHVRVCLSGPILLSLLMYLGGVY